MIIISKKIDGNQSEPSRQLTAEEKVSVIATWGDGDNYWYFQKADKETNTPQWQSYQLSINPPELLSDAIQKKLEEIDTHTQELIFKGFTYNGKKFSLSITAQINWSNIPNLPDQFFPLYIQAQDNSIVSLPLSEKMAFYLTAVGGKNAPLQSGIILKGQVSALTNIDDVKNFTDNR